MPTLAYEWEAQWCRAGGAQGLSPLAIVFHVIFLFWDGSFNLLSSYLKQVLIRNGRGSIVVRAHASRAEGLRFESP